MQGKSSVLLLTTAYLPMVGGSELAIKEITRRLPDVSFDIVTAKFDTAHPDREVHGNVTIHRVGNDWHTASFLMPKNFLPLAIAYRALRLMGRRQYIAVHAYQASQAAGAAWLIKLLYPEIQFILTLQEGKDLSSQGAMINFFRRLIISSADIVTVISHHLESYVRSIDPTGDIRLIPNGVDELFFVPQNNAELKARLGITDEKVVMTISRLVPKNGIDDLVTAFVSIAARTAKLVIVGSGPLEGALRKTAVRLSIADRVIFVGTVDYHELPGYLSLAHVFVRPSRSEGLGTAFLEPRAAGVPVIGTPVGGIPDFLTDGETGLFCRPSNPTDIAQKIDRLLNDRELADHIRENARGMVRERYTWDTIATTFNHLYGSIQ